MQDDEEARFPVHLLIDATLRPLADQGIYHYIRQRGERNSGVILLKLNGLAGKCRLLNQQRNLDGQLGWINALREEFIEESQVDAYIARSVLRDPDLWVIEIEDRAMANPFEGKIAL